ncbi:MAG TPA: hypothetical protein VF556_07990 [Pyrinomonadaceae bacterium]|jgi:hypothetical protein
MAKFDNPLNNIKIASPCSADWNRMMGDERKRYCGDCKLNVYNLSGMTRAEAENLLINSEGRLCVRFYRRADGTVLTKDCPVGWQLLKRRVSKTAATVASFIFAVLGGLGLNSFFNQTKKPIPTVGAIAVQDVENVPLNNNFNIETENKIDDNSEIMGKYAPGISFGGAIYNVEEVRQKVKEKRRR